MGFTPDAPPKGFTPDAPPERGASDTDTQHPLSDAVKFFASSLKNAPEAVKSMISQAGDMVQDPYGTMAHTFLNAAKTAKQAIENPEATVSSVGSALSNATPEQAGATVGAPIVAGLGVGGLAKGVGALAGAGSDAAAAAASPAGQLGLRSTVGRPVAAFAAGDTAGPVLDAQNNNVARRAMGREVGVPNEQPVNHTTLAAAAAPPGEVLNTGASLLPTAHLSEAAQAAIRAARPAETLAPGTPDVDNYVSQTERNLLGTDENPAGPVTGEQVRATRTQMAGDAALGRNSADAAVRDKAKYQQAIVNALDQHIADTMPEGSAISPEQIANARATLAKNYTLRDLITKGGDVDLQALAADHRANPGKYTGVMQTVAQFAHEHPEVTGAISDADRISPPSLAHDVANINPTKPIGSLSQALFGAAGRRSLRGPGNGSAAMGAAESGPMAGLGGEFDLKPVTALSPPAGQVGPAPDRQIPAPLAPPTTSAPGSRPNMPSLQPPAGTAFEPHQGELGLDPTLSEGARPLKRAPEGAQTSATLSDHDTALVNGVKDWIDQVNQKIGATPGVGARGAMGKIVGHLADNMKGDTEEGAFFKNIFTRLKGQNLATRLVAPGSPGHEDLGSAFGSYQMGNDTATLGNLKTDPLITIAHEAVHAATAAQIEGNLNLKADLTAVMRNAADSPAVKALATQDQYGALSRDKFSRPQVHDLVAESQTNPRFQQALRNSPSPINQGQSLYDDLKKAIGTALKLPPTAYNDPRFDKILDGNGPSVA